MAGTVFVIEWGDWWDTCASASADGNCNTVFEKESDQLARTVGEFWYPRATSYPGRIVSVRVANMRAG